MSRWVRTAVLALIITAIAIASTAHATTWVFWVGAPNANSPANATSATWGPYWKDYVFLYSTQPVRWEVSTTPYWGPPYISTTKTGVDFNPFGSSGYETWIALSSAYALNGYVYQGTVGAYSNVAIGSTYTFSSGYQYFVAVAWYSVSTETCGQLYFHADVYNNSTSTAMFYDAYIIANGTWSYVTFFSEAVPSGSWFNPAVPGPSTCLKGYYVYIATIAVNTTETTVGTAQISIGTTSEGTSYTPGTQYSWSKSPASGDTIVVPWTSYANSYINYFVQQVVNTGGSGTSGTFILSFPTYMSDYWNNFYSTHLTSSMFVFAYDNDTGYFPQSTITVVGCPSGVYMLPATISPSVTELLSCSGITSPSSGIAIYPTDYGKYASSPASYNPPVGYLATFSYTDSAGNTYSLPDYFAVPTTVYLYMTSGSYSITTRQVSFPLQTNMTLFSFQPTNQYVYNQLTAPGTTVSNNGGGEGYVLLIPPGYVKNNPYWFGATGWFALPNAVFSTYSAVTMVFWVYQPPNGQGGLFTQVNAYPLINYWGSWLYIRNGYVYYGDSMGTLSAPIGAGWHMITVEVWASSTSGPYYEAMYVDGQYIGTASSSSETQLGRAYLYGVIGMVWLGGSGGYFIYNGTIAYVAIYNTVLNSSQVQQLYQVGFPNTLFSNNLVVAYVLSNTTYYVYDGVSHFYIKPYFANQQILSQLGITNASLITITPTGQVGWVPFTQWQQVTNYSVISYCKLMSYYTFNYLGGSKYQVVLVTNQNMNQFPLDYQFLVTSGSGNQYVLPVYAYGNTNTFTNTTSTTPPANANLPVCGLYQNIAVYFEGVYPNGINSLGYQPINVTTQLTFNSLHVQYSNIAGVGVPNASSLYVYVNGLPNGWAPDVWDSKVGAWSYEYNYTISSSGTYYLVTATELVQLASPPVSQLPYEAIVVEMTNGALVTSLPTLYLITNSTGVYTPLFGGSGSYVPGVLVASPYYYATSSGSASGPSVGTQNALPYGIAYWVVAADTNSIPFILGFNGAFSEDLMFPGLVNGVYFYAPSPTGYGSAYLPANTTKLVNAPVTFQVSFYVSSSSASGVLLAEENNYYPNTPTYYVPIIWLNNGVVYAYLGGSCGTATQVVTVSAGNTYAITLYWNPANNTGEAYINGVEVAKSTSPVSCNAGQSMPYVAVGDGYTNGWANTNNGWFPLSGVQIYYVAVWYNQLSDTTPSGNPTFLYEPSLPPNTNAMVFGSSVSAFSLMPGQPVYLGTYNGINGYQMKPFKFEYPEASSSTSTTAAASPILVTTGLQPSVNPPPSIQFTWLGASGPAGGFYYSFSSSGFDYVGALNGFFKNGYTATIGSQKTPGGYSIPGIVTDSFNVTAVGLYANGASLPSNTFAYYIPEIDFIQPGQTYYLYIPQSGVGYIGLNYMTSNIVSEDFTRACQPTNTIPSLGTTTFQWYWLNGIAWTQQSGKGSGTWWWGFVNSGSNEGFLIINGSSILFATLLSRLNVSSIAAWSGGSSVTVDLSVTQSGQPIWLAPLYLVFAYSGQYVYGLYANSIEVEPNYMSYSVTLPTCLANNPVTVTAYSVSTQEITSLLLTLTNPLNVILGATTVTPYPVPNNVTVGSSGKPSTTSNTTSSGVPIIQIGATQQPVVLPWWGTTLQSFIQINLATPIGIIGVGLIFGLLAYYWRTNRSGLLALAGGGIALFIIGAALSSIPLIALGLFITMVSIAAFYVKRS